MFFLHFLLCVLLMLGTTSSTFINDDGVLVTAADEVRALTATWNVVVTIDKPRSPSDLITHFDALYASISAIDVTALNDSTAITSWIRRLERMRYRVTSLFATTVFTSDSTHRQRRGLVDFIGEIGKSLFGIATEADLQHVLDAVQQVDSSQQGIVHVVNDMMTVVNQTYESVHENRRHLNAVITHQNTFIQVLQRMSQSLFWTEQRVSQLRVHMELERALSELNTLLHNYADSVHRYHDQRYALERHALSPDLFSMSMLHECLQRATHNGLYSALPLDWYYENVVVVPLISSTAKTYLTFLAPLPLVTRESFLSYIVTTFPVPFAHDMLAQITNADGTYAYDTSRGYMFAMNACRGSRPIVCNPIILHDRAGLSCPRGLITNDARLRDQCHVSFSALQNGTHVYPYDFNQYVVILTRFRKFTQNCVGRPEQIFSFEPGIHHLVIPSNCSFQIPTEAGGSLLVRGLYSTSRPVYVQHNLVQNFTFDLPQLSRRYFKLAMAFDNMSTLTDMPPLIPLRRLKIDHLQPLRLDTTSTVSILTFVNAAVNVILVSGLVIIGCIIYKRMRKYNLSHPKVKTLFQKWRPGPSTVPPDDRPLPETVSLSSPPLTLDDEEDGAKTPKRMAPPITLAEALLSLGNDTFV